MRNGLQNSKCKRLIEKLKFSSLFDQIMQTTRGKRGRDLRTREIVILACKFHWHNRGMLVTPLYFRGFIIGPLLPTLSYWESTEAIKLSVPYLLKEMYWKQLWYYHWVGLEIELGLLTRELYASKIIIWLWCYHCAHLWTKSNSILIAVKAWLFLCIGLYKCRINIESSSVSHDDDGLHFVGCPDEWSGLLWCSWSRSIKCHC